MFYLIFADKRGHFCENATEHRVEYRFANNVKPETGPAARNRSAPKTSRIDRNSTGSRPPNFRYGPRVHHRFPRLDEFQSSNERRGSKNDRSFLFFSFFLPPPSSRVYKWETRANNFSRNGGGAIPGKATRWNHRGTNFTTVTGRREAFIICGLRSDPRYPRYRGPSLEEATAEQRRREAEKLDGDEDWKREREEGRDSDFEIWERGGERGRDLSVEGMAERRRRGRRENNKTKREGGGGGKEKIDTSGGVITDCSPWL